MLINNNFYNNFYLLNPDSIGNPDTLAALHFDEAYFVTSGYTPIIDHHDNWWRKYENKIPYLKGRSAFALFGEKHLLKQVHFTCPKAKKAVEYLKKCMQEYNG